VLVNGQPAKSTAENFAEWTITLHEPGTGEVALTANAVDVFGNVEPRPHRLLVRAAPGSALNWINLPPQEKPGDGVKPEPRKPSQAQQSGPDVEAIQGTWRMVSQQRAGRATARPTNMKWIIEGETIWLVIDHEGNGAPAEKQPASKKPIEKKESPVGKGGKPAGPQRGIPMSFRLNPAGSPKRIDIDGPRKGISLGICQLDGDELTLCMGITQASPRYDQRAKNDENSRPARINPEAGTVIVLRRIR
jgi:uncharacterized protein (TIGR03067 family)